jgi:hypothetical protein
MKTSVLRKKAIGLTAAGCLGLLLGSAGHAATLTFELDISFGTDPAPGPTPWVTAIFDDGGSDGTVDLDLTVGGAAVDEWDITQLYFNLNPVLDPTSLTFNRVAGTGPTAAETSISNDGPFKADGGGYYDIWFAFGPAPDSARFNTTETLAYEISGIASLSALDFNFLGDPSGGNGPFLAAAKVQSTPLECPLQGGGTDPNCGSDWIAANASAVPVPASAWLFGSALGLLGWTRRKLN